MWLTEGDDTRKVVFSGDIGNRDQPIIRDPQYIRDADYVLTESTYGDRLHDMDKDPDYTADLAAIIDETLGRGGNVIIPSFAVGRHPGAALLHPGDQGKRSCHRPRQLPGLHRQPAGH